MSAGVVMDAGLFAAWLGAVAWSSSIVLVAVFLPLFALNFWYTLRDDDRKFEAEMSDWCRHYDAVWREHHEEETQT